MKKLKKSSFLEGAFIATFCIILTKILGVLYVIPFYKIIGEKGGTLYGYAYNIYNIFLIISSAGIPLAISKLTSEYNTLKMHDKKIKMYQIATRIIMAFSVMSFLICFIFAPQLSHIILGELEGGNTINDVTFVIRLISFALLVIPLLSIERGYLQGHRYINEPSVSQVIEQITRITVILIGSYLCTYIFKLDIKYSVGISVFAACVGGIATYIYLKVVVKHNKKQIGLDVKPNTTKAENKEIIKKLIGYSIPFIIINLANTVYTSTDMILIIRTLPKLGFSATDTEFITSVFTTWGVKFNTIVTSIATGLAVSLIPNMVKDYNENNMHAVNFNFNKCLTIILLIVTPLAIFMSSMSTSFWNIFYSSNKYGIQIIKLSILLTILDSLYTVTNSLLQSINKQKIIYISIITGIGINLALDIPFMYLFNKLNLPAYYGAITATIIGMTFSVSVSLIYLNKIMKLNYQDTIKIIPKCLISIALILISTTILKQILPIDSSNRIIQLFNIAITGIVSFGIHLLICFDDIKQVIPKKLLNKLKINVN